MFKVICITQRSAAEDFFGQIEKICAGGIDRIILREKDMDEKAYEQLALRVMEICGRYSTPLSLHTYTETAERLGIKDIHLTCEAFMSGRADGFAAAGVSVHSVDEACAAADKAPAYITAGHIFPTDCKKGVPPRGTDFLADICGAVKPFNVPVYAIGGITPDNAGLCAKAGAAGVCVMSSMMKSSDPAELINALRLSAEVQR